MRDYAAGRQRQRDSSSRSGTPGRAFTTLPEDDESLSFDFGPYEPVTALDEDAVDYTTILAAADLGDADEILDGAREVGALSFDTETTSVNSMEASLVGVALADRDRRAVYVPTPLGSTQTPEILDRLRSALEDDALPKVGHNVKYDLNVLARHGLSVGGPVFDTMIAHYLIDPEASHKLDDVSSFYLNYRPQPITELIGTGKNALSMRDVPVEEVGPYACEDADVALRLVPVLTEKLESMDENGRLLEIAETIEFPLVRVLARMEQNGVKVSTDILDDIREQLDAQIEEQEAKIFELAGRAFTIGSPKQIGEVLFKRATERRRDGGLPDLAPGPSRQGGRPDRRRREAQDQEGAR